VRIFPTRKYLGKRGERKDLGGSGVSQHLAQFEKAIGRPR